jgi:lantibiotic modifying enzyme
MPLERRDGFHAGSLGIAWAAIRAAELLEEDELREGARTVVVEARPPATPDRCPDVILGSAGAILALLALADACDDPALVGDAIATGKELTDRATVSRHGWSWEDPSRRYRGHLCGLSHGSAGIGWALLELFAVTRDERFRTGAEGAFAYERSWLDADSGTWPDLRIGGQRRDRARTFASPATGTWCHGEGGIALTRLRAIAVLGPEPYRQEAELALEATRRQLARALPYETQDFTLCHGAAGAADVLLCGAAALGRAAEPVRELGLAALEHHGAGRERWPCGAGAGTTPALFRGLSGIAWWLLRLHDPAIQSALMLPMNG